MEKPIKVLGSRRISCAGVGYPLFFMVDARRMAQTTDVVSITKGETPGSSILFETKNTIYHVIPAEGVPL